MVLPGSFRFIAFIVISRFAVLFMSAVKRWCEIPCHAKSDLSSKESPCPFGFARVTTTNVCEL